MAVLEGDMTTQLDAEAPRSCRCAGGARSPPVAPAISMRPMVSGGLRQLQARLSPADLDLLWVENVGNLVCSGRI